MTRLREQVALVTGAGHGIGRAITCAFAAEGAHVVASDIDAEAASATIVALGSDGSVAVQADVTSPESLDRLFGRVSKQFGRLDVLVNNAGTFHVAPLLEFPLDAWRHVFAVNLDGALLGTQRAARMMQAQQPHPATGCRGKIISIGSPAAERGRPFMAAYGASKAALNHLAKSTALVLAKHSIATSVVYPTSVQEGMFGPIAVQMAEFEGMTPEEFTAQRAAASPLGRLQKPEEVAAIVTWVAAHPGMALNGQLVRTEAHVAPLA